PVPRRGGHRYDSGWPPPVGQSARSGGRAGSGERVTAELTTFSGTHIERLFALTQDLLCVAGADGYFKQVNPAFTRILGWPSELLLAHPFLQFVHPDDHAR